MAWRRSGGFGSLVTTLSIIHRACAWKSIPLARPSLPGLTFAPPCSCTSAGFSRLGMAASGKRAPSRARMCSVAAQDGSRDGALPEAFSLGDGEQAVPLVDLGKLGESLTFKAASPSHPPNPPATPSPNADACSDGRPGCMEAHRRRRGQDLVWQTCKEEDDGIQGGAAQA